MKNERMDTHLAGTLAIHELMEFTPKQLEAGYDDWRIWLLCHCVHSWHLDDWMRPFLKSEPRPHWLKNMRQTFLVSTREMARRLSLSQTAYLKWERREEKKNITIEELERVARAYDCDLIYGFKPKEGKLPSQIMFEKMSPDMKFDRTKSLRIVAVDLFRCPSYRRKRGWTRSRTND